MLLVCRPFSATKKRQCLRISLALHVVCISSFALHSPHAARLHTINSKTTLRSKGPAISIPHDVRSYNLITESLRPGNAKSRTAASSPIHRTDTSVKSFFLFAPPSVCKITLAGPGLVLATRMDSFAFQLFLFFSSCRSFVR